MTNEPRNARAIFVEAVERVPVERWSIYLDEACGDDPTLRAHVQRLLEAHAEIGSFMERPAAASPAIDQPPLEQLGTRIGTYTLLQVIGQGGMGVVFMAEQKEPVERRVALKIIKPGMDTQQVLARFEAEEQALAVMDHPNIARVFEAGTTEAGRPYFAMELVRGIPITQYCDEHHLTPRERLELFVPVCHAIQHAHQKAIIHRDIKPSNVLVAEYDSRPVPKIIDFGVAKAIRQRLTEQTLFTQLGQVVGTIDYMSPEQAKLNELDVDTRSDIYSLGVLLYELLTGATPLDRQRLHAAAFDEMLRIIREEEPPRPSVRLSSSDSLPSIAANRRIEPRKLSSLVHGELDWIVMKALDKDRSRRYETANALANDIQRYLNDEAVVACPPSATYRFRKFARRHQAAITTAALIAAALVVATAISTWQATRATRAAVAERRANEEAHQAELDAKRQWFRAAVAQAKASRFSGRQGQRLEALKAVEEATGLLASLGLGDDDRSTVRDEAIGSLELVDLRPLQTWRARQNLDAGLTFLSGDFDLWAFGQEGLIHVRQTDDPQADVARIPVAQGMYEPCLSFDVTKRYLLRRRFDDFTLYVAEIATVKDVLAVPETIMFEAADFHPRTPHIAVGDRHGTVRCFDLVSGQETHKWSVGRTVWSVKYDAEGARLAIGSGPMKTGSEPMEMRDPATGKVEVRDAVTGEVVFQTPPLDVRSVLAWSPDGKCLAVGTTPDIHLFQVDGAQGQPLVLHGHRSTVIGLQFHPQGHLLASTSWDGTTRLWDTATAQQLLRLEGHLIGFSENGDLMACRQGLDVVIFEVVSPCAHRWLSHGMTYAVAVAPGDRLMASCHDDGVRFWDLDRLEQRAYLPIGLTRGVVFRAPAGHFVTSGKAGLYQWPIRVTSQGGVERVRLGPPDEINASLKNMRSVHCSRDGSTLLAEAYFRDEVFVLRPDESDRRDIRLSRPGLSLSALSADGKWAAASSSTAPDVRIWNAITGEHVCDLLTSGGAQIGFSPDGGSVITNCGTEMRVWDVGSWKVRHQMLFTSDSASAIAFTPDNRLAAIGAWGIGVVLIDVDSGRRVAMLDLPEKPPVYVGLAFTADGSRLMAAVDHAGCCVWDIRALRDRLTALGLDWNSPPLAEAPFRTAKPPLQVEVDLGTLAGLLDHPRDTTSETRSKMQPSVTEGNRP